VSDLFELFGGWLIRIGLFDVPNQVRGEGPREGAIQNLAFFVKDLCKGEQEVGV
jgi:hypothetical protein